MAEGYDWLWYKKKCPHRKELGQYHTPRDCPECLLDARESFRYAYQAERVKVEQEDQSTEG